MRIYVLLRIICGYPAYHYNKVLNVYLFIYLYLLIITIVIDTAGVDLHILWIADVDMD